MRRHFMVYAFFFMLISHFLFATNVNDRLRQVQCQEGIYGIGAAQSDITGPIAELPMMGYADISQRTGGLHMRLRSRAFVFYDPCKETFASVVIADLGMIFSSIKQGVLQELKEKAPGIFTHENLLLSATHTHSGPGGYAHYPLYNVTTIGFNQQNYQAIVKGISLSIEKALRSITAGKISYGEVQLPDITFNRSVGAYQHNPAFEIEANSHATNSAMQMLKFEDVDGRVLGSINWFAIHPVSLGIKNNLVSSDNKGLAAYLLERKMAVTYRHDDEFVGAFAQADEGDVSPYDVHHPPQSSDEEFRALHESAIKQADAAWQLQNQKLMQVKGPIDVRHQFVDMKNFVVDNHFTHVGEKRLCSAALGESFAAGTENGKPNIAVFDEGIVNENPGDSCQQQKPVLIAAGDLRLAPNIIPFQVVRIGDMLILAPPSEMTTMSGRRLRSTIAALWPGQRIIIAGLSNEYSHYVATPEEYSLQHYEGASTLYGPWTEAAYRQIFSRLTKSLLHNQRLFPGGPTQPDMSDAAIEIMPGVIFDRAGNGKEFGDVEANPRAHYKRGEKVEVEFVGAHPNNDLKTNDTYFSVERLTDRGFERIYFDWDPNTTLRWHREFFARSRIIITWQTNNDDVPDTYRICHFGAAKMPFTGDIKSYQGCSHSFLLK